MQCVYVWCGLHVGPGVVQVLGCHLHAVRYHFDPLLWHAVLLTLGAAEDDEPGDELKVGRQHELTDEG